MHRGAALAAMSYMSCKHSILTTHTFLENSHVDESDKSVVLFQVSTVAFLSMKLVPPFFSSISGHTFLLKHEICSLVAIISMVRFCFLHLMLSADSFARVIYYIVRFWNLILKIFFFQPKVTCWCSCTLYNRLNVALNFQKMKYGGVIKLSKWWVPIPCMVTMSIIM